MVASILMSLLRVALLNIILFLVFEIVPLFFGFRNTIKKNIRDFFEFQLVRLFFINITYYLFVVSFTLLNIKKGIIDISGLSIFYQIIILHLCLDFFGYLLHILIHTS